jgi:hypothetical protein
VRQDVGAGFRQGARDPKLGCMGDHRHAGGVALLDRGAHPGEVRPKVGVGENEPDLDQVRRLRQLATDLGARLLRRLDLDDRRVVRTQLGWRVSAEQRAGHRDAGGRRRPPGEGSDLEVSHGPAHVDDRGDPR